MQLSSAAVCQNILLCAQSLGYAAQWITEYSYDEVITQELTKNNNDVLDLSILEKKRMNQRKG